jgi:hypothetical protein
LIAKTLGRDMSHIIVEPDTCSESIHPEKSCEDVLRKTRSLYISYQYETKFFQKEMIDEDKNSINLIFRFDENYKNVRQRNTDRFEEAIQFLNWTEFLPE